MTTERTSVIVGASLAGAKAAETLRGFATPATTSCVASRPS